jgi:transposase InsO family protein
MISNLFDNSIVAYKTGTEQTVNLVLNTIKLAMEKETVAGELHLHSDQGFQYTSQAYFSLTKEYGITPSMLRRGNCYDNALAENFFSMLKTECIYKHKLKSFDEARQLMSSPNTWIPTTMSTYNENVPDTARKAASGCVIFQYSAVGLFILCPFTLIQFIYRKSTKSFQKSISK